MDSSADFRQNWNEAIMRLKESKVNLSNIILVPKDLKPKLDTESKEEADYE